MKRLPLILCFLILLTLMNACLVVSLQPVGTRADRIFDPDLVGSWTYKEGTYHFHSQGDSLYHLELYVQQAFNKTTYDTMNFEVSLHQVGDFLFLDYFPYDEDVRSEQILYHNYIPVHTFVKLQKYDARHFELSYFDYDRLQKLFEQNRIRLRYEMVEDITILTDGTAEIQRFLKKYAGETEAFGDIVQLKR